MVDTGCIDTDNRHASLNEHLGSCGRDTRKVQVRGIARNIAAQVLLRVRPEAAPARPDEHDVVGLDAPVPLFVALDVGDRQLIVGIALALRRNVNHRCRADQLIDWNVSRRTLAFPEVNRGVKMRSAVLTPAVSERAVPIATLGPALGRTHVLERLIGRPVECRLIKRVGEVDDTIAVKGELRRPGATRQEHWQQQKRPGMTTHRLLRLPLR